MSLDRDVYRGASARGELALRTPVIADDLYMNGGGYHELSADSTSRAFEVCRDSADTAPPPNMTSDDPAPAGTVV